MLAAPPRSTFQTCQQMVEKHVVGVRQDNVRCGLFTMKAKMWVSFFAVDKHMKVAHWNIDAVTT